MSEIIWTKQEIYTMFQPLALSFSLVSTPRYPPKYTATFSSPLRRSDLKGWPLALRPQYVLKPTLDIRVWVERKVINWSSGPQYVRTEPWSLDAFAAE